MNEVKPRFDLRALAMGLVMIGIGLTFLLDRMRIADFHEIVRTYWPLFLIGLGVANLLEARSFWSGLWLIAIGVWLQVTVLHLFDLTFGTSWPLLLILLGAGTVVRAIVEGARGRRSDATGGDRE